MQVRDKTLTFDRTLWVQYGGVDVAEQGALLVVTGRDEDSYLKVFNHFGRLLKLYTFEAERWVDADTGAPAQSLDESQAGHLPGSAEAPARPGSKGAGKPGPAAAGTAKTGARKSAVAASKAGKPTPRKPAAARPATRKPASSPEKRPKAAKSSAGGAAKGRTGARGA